VKKYILILAVVVVVMNWGSISNKLSPPPDYAAAHEGKVILYATTWCGYCKEARKLFKENDIDYFEYDVEKSEEGREQFRKLGGKGVPLILIDGEVLKGFDAEQILALAK